MQDQAHNLRTLMMQATLAQTAECPRPEMLWVTTGKRGVGSSTLVVNLAAALARKGKRVLIASTSEQPRDLDTLCGLAETVDRRTNLRQGPAGLLVLTQDANALTTSLDDRVQHLLTMLQAYHGCVDIAIVDVGPRFTGTACVPWGKLDTVLYVTTAESAVVMDTYAAIKDLIQLCDDSPPRIGLLVNRTVESKQGRCIHERIAETCQRFLGTEIVLVGDVPRDRTLCDSRRSVLPAVLQSPTSAVARAIDRVAAAVTK